MHEFTRRNPSIILEILRESSRTREDRKLFALLMRRIQKEYACESLAVFLNKRATGRLYKFKAIGKRYAWDETKIFEFFLNRKPEIEERIVMAPVRIGPVVVGVMAMRAEKPFARGVGKALTSLLHDFGAILEWRRKRGVIESQLRVVEAVLKPIPPKDIIYRILHTMRRFIDYDHSATLLEIVSARTVSVVARQVAWTKGKSRLIGRNYDLDLDMIGLEKGAILSQDRIKNLGFDLISETGAPPRGSSIVILVRGRNRRGLLEVSSTRENFFLEADLSIIARFQPYLGWCLDRLVR